MTMKRVDQAPEKSVPPVLDLAKLPNDFTTTLKFAPMTDEDLAAVAGIRAASDPWRSRSETMEQTQQTISKLRPFVHVSKYQNHIIGYVTVERDGPVAGAAYMRNIVVKPELRQKGIGTMLLNHAMQIARDLHRRTLALRVDPANSAAVSFYRKAGFTTVATVVSKKSGKLRLLMSREL
jgi:ribosomal-protein-alanine N-acetyltransferase